MDRFAWLARNAKGFSLSEAWECDVYWLADFCDSLDRLIAKENGK